MDHTAAEILSVSDIFDRLFRQRREERAQAVRETADRIERHMGDWAEQLRRQLQAQLDGWNRVGIPPSFVKIAGQSHLEKPLNRLLAWWVDPAAEHGFGTEFLKRLAALVDLPTMVDDLNRGDKPEVIAEQSLDDDESGKEPDLMVRTRSAALLLENKLWSPESGDQYGPYLQVLRLWAGKTKQRRAVLCAHDQRPVPKGWDQTIRHDDLARMLDELSHLDSAPVWGRITAAVCARSFDAVDVGERVCQARDLLEETAHSGSTPGQISRLRAALPLPKPPTPWEISENG